MFGDTLSCEIKFKTMIYSMLSVPKLRLSKPSTSRNLLEAMQVGQQVN